MLNTINLRPREVLQIYLLWFLQEMISISCLLLLLLIFGGLYYCFRAVIYCRSWWIRLSPCRYVDSFTVNQSAKYRFGFQYSFVYNKNLRQSVLKRSQLFP